MRVVGLEDGDGAKPFSKDNGVLGHGFFKIGDQIVAVLLFLEAGKSHRCSRDVTFPG